MSAPLDSRQNHVTVSPSKPARAVQTVQGGYYGFAGLLVAFLIESIQGPADGPRPGNELWLVRVVGLAVAGFGVALILSGRRAGRGFVPAGAGMWVALALLAQTAAGMALGVLPITFLLDAGLEALFVAWWVVVMFRRVDRATDRAAPQPS